VRFRIALTLLPAIVCSGIVPCMAAKSEYPDPKRFEAQILAFEAKDKEQPPPRGAIVCIGSSSMKGWHEHIGEDLAPLTVIPRGFGGSDMNDAAYYADRIVIPYAPRAIVIYEGDNDIAAGIAPEKVRDAFREFVKSLRKRLPTARIYVMSIKPSPSRWAFWPKMQEANRLLAQECSRNKRLKYVDITAAMLDAGGQPLPDIFLADNLHMNRKGYELWRDVLRPVLMKSELRYEKQKPVSR